MTNINEIINRLNRNKFDQFFIEIYGDDLKVIKSQKIRYIEAINSFTDLYGDDREIELYSTPGRTEVGGNHTDHNSGKVLAASIDLDIIAIVSKNDNNTIRVKSEGHDQDIVDISITDPIESEKHKSISLIRGICAKLKQMGYNIGGFDAYTTNDVLIGSGLSSSAAFEVLIGSVLNHLYCNKEVDDVKIAQIAQYAENEYFGKPCGLMDQIACSVGGFVTIDFLDNEKPIVEKIDFDFASLSYSLVIVDTGGDHADLTEDYTAVRKEMNEVAEILGGSVLRKSSLNDLMNNIEDIRKMGNDMAILRSFHFYNENIRVGSLIDALKNNDFDKFKKIIIESGNSSWKLCQNCYSPSKFKEQGIPLALTISEYMLKNKGAWRVHGGGFAGTIQAFVPCEIVDGYITEMEKIFGLDSCYKLFIRPLGNTKLY